MKVGFIGLGGMGHAMAQNLLKVGHELTVYNRTRSKAEEMGREGAKVAGSPGDAASGEAVITMLADDHAVEDVIFGPGAVLEKLKAGQMHISMSTIGVALSKRLAETHHGRGQVYVSAPVFGRPDAAAAGKLFIVAAGPKGAVAKCEPLFSAMGQRTFDFGEDPPAANVIKLSGNFLIAATLECLGEAFALARKYGIDPQAYLDMLTSSFLSAPLHKNYGGIIAQQKYEPAGFVLRLGLKDVRLVLAAADAASTPMPVASVLHDNFLAAIARGMGEKDWSAIAKLAAENAGLK